MGLGSCKLGPLVAKVSILRFLGNGVLGFGVPDVSNWKRVGLHTYVPAWRKEWMRIRSASSMLESVLTLLGLGPGPDQRKWSNAIATALRARGGQSITCRAKNIGKCSSASECCASEMPGGVVYCTHSELSTQWLLEAVVFPSEVLQPRPKEKGIVLAAEGQDREMLHLRKLHLPNYKSLQVYKMTLPLCAAFLICKMRILIISTFYGQDIITTPREAAQDKGSCYQI